MKAQLSKGIHFSPDMDAYVANAFVVGLCGAYFGGWYCCWLPINYYLHMHKKISHLLLVFLFAAGMAYSQENVPPTDKFVIEGKVKNSFGFSLDQAGQYKTTGIDSIVIYNHLLQRKRVIKNIKGVLLKDIIDKAVIDISAPKLLSEIYITCVASDNYKVVFSWNELFNTDIGKHVMVITESDGKPAKDGQDRIAIISTADQATGRRFVKSLSKIIIEQVK